MQNYKATLRVVTGDNYLLKEVLLTTCQDSNENNTVKLSPSSCLVYLLQGTLILNMRFFLPDSQSMIVKNRVYKSRFVFMFHSDYHENQQKFMVRSFGKTTEKRALDLFLFVLPTLRFYNAF